jgi:hypothetical protein
MAGLTQNYGKTNRKERKEREGKRVSESSCVSPIWIEPEEGVKKKPRGEGK